MPFDPLVQLPVCCSVLQCVAVSHDDSLLTWTMPFDPLVQLPVCCGVLQCVAVCCSVLQCIAVCCCMLQRWSSSVSILATCEL